LIVSTPKDNENLEIRNASYGIVCIAESPRDMNVSPTFPHLLSSRNISLRSTIYVEEAQDLLSMSLPIGTIPLVF
jgi:hypothetical protein